MVSSAKNVDIALALYLSFYRVHSAIENTHVAYLSTLLLIVCISFTKIDLLHEVVACGAFPHPNQASEIDEIELEVSISLSKSIVVLLF